MFAEPLLEVRNIIKSYAGVIVLDNVHLTVQRGEIHALLGENGAGKSTLMKILTGVEKADSGTIVYKGKPLVIHHPKEIQNFGIGIVYQEYNLLPDLTVAQNIFIGREPDGKIKGFLDDRRLVNEAQGILDVLKSKISPLSKVSSLSVAEQQIVEIAKALSYNCELLIMDEPTAALTDAEINILFSIIRNLKINGVSIIYISHRMSDLDAVVDSVTVLRDGKFIAHHPYTKDLINTLIQEMVGRELTNKYPPKPEHQKGEKALSIKHLTGNNLLHDISFDVFEGEILGIFGLVGAGRTELAKTIFGALNHSSGEIFLKGKRVIINSPDRAFRLGLGYLSEDRKKDGLLLNLNIKENIILPSYPRYSKWGMIQDKVANKDTDAQIQQLRVKAQSRSQLVVTLSGGNQQKIVLAKLICKNAKILILDEPTRGIDVGSKYEIYELIYELVRQGTTVILISSELPEVMGICDRILVMAEGNITGEVDPRTTSQEEILQYAMGK